MKNEEKEKEKALIRKIRDLKVNLSSSRRDNISSRELKKTDKKRMKKEVKNTSLYSGK